MPLTEDDVAEVREACAEAWDEGFVAGTSGVPPENPYRQPRR